LKLRQHGRLLQQSLKSVSVVLCCYRVELFLSRLLIEVVVFKIVVARLVASIDEDTQLHHCKRVSHDRLDVRYFNRIDNFVNTSGAVEAKEDAIRNGDVVRISPPAVETAVVLRLRKQLRKHSLLQ